MSRRPEVLRLELDQEAVGSGGVLAGTLAVRLKNPLRTGIIRLKVVGEMKTSWKEDVGGKAVRFSGAETLLDERIGLWDRETRVGVAEPLLLPGLHRFPFHVDLPPEAPPSFQGRHGSISYRVCAIVSKPLKAAVEAVEDFAVLGSKTAGADADDPVHRTSAGDKAPVTAALRLSRNAFAPGDAILLQATVDNNSSETVADISASLIQTAIYTGRDKSGSEKTKEKETIVEQTSAESSVGPGSSWSWAEGALLVPQTPPTLRRPGLLIRLSYAVELSVRGWASVRVPIRVLSATRGPPPLPPRPTSFLASPLSSPSPSEPPPSYLESFQHVNPAFRRDD